MYPNQPLDGNQPVGPVPPVPNTQPNVPDPSENVQPVSAQPTGVPPAGATFQPNPTPPLGNSPYQPQATALVQPPPLVSPTASNPPLDANGVSSAYPAMANDYYQGNNTGKTLGVLSLVFSLIPIVGLVLGIISVVKGYKSANKMLTILGGLAIPLSLVMAVILYTFVYPALTGATKYSDLTSGTYKAVTYDGEVEYSFAYPAGMEILEQNDSAVALADKNKEGATISSMMVFTSSLYGQKPGTVLNLVTEKEFTDTAEKVYGLDNIQITNLTKGAKDYTIEFSAQGKANGGEAVKLLGTGHGKLTDVSVIESVIVAAESVWNRNESILKEAGYSVQIDKEPPSKTAQQQKELENYGYSTRTATNADLNDLGLDGYDIKPEDVKIYDLNNQFNIRRLMWRLL